MLPATLQFIIAMIVCAINERMQHKLDYAQEEIRVLKEALRAATGSSRISFTADQRRRLAVAGKIPAQSPNCNPHAERFVKTIKYECLNQFIFFGERHLRHVLKEFVEHYLAERFHQGLGGQLVNGQAGSANDKETKAPITCRSRLGGLLNYYHRDAA